MKRLLAAVGATVVAEAALGVAILYFGLAPVGADRPPSALEARVLGVALRQAVLRQTSGAEEPAAPSDEDLANGREIYGEMCSRCHGEPGAAASPLGSSFYPPAPLLPGRESRWSERELFWIIKHGIRNTAMPAWAALLTDDDIRQVAALVKRFDTVSNVRAPRREPPVERHRADGRPQPDPARGDASFRSRLSGKRARRDLRRPQPAVSVDVKTERREEISALASPVN